MNQQQIIDRAIKSGRLEVFNSAVQEVTVSKIADLGLNEEVRLDIQPLVKNFTVPVRVGYELHYPQPQSAPKRIQPSNVVAWIAVGLIIGLIMVWLVPRIDWWSVIACAALVAAWRVWGNGKGKPSEKVEPEVRTVIDTNVEDVMNKIESFVGIVRVISESKSSGDSKSLAEQISNPTLYEKFPNVVKWLQNIYAAKYEFDETGRKYLDKQIPRLLKQMYYEVVMFDGNNIALFEIDRDPGVDGTELIYPAIVDTRSNKIVLKGRVCNP